MTIAAAPIFMLSGYPFEIDLFLPLVLYLFALATAWLIPLFGWVVIACSILMALQVIWLVLSEFPYLAGSDLPIIVLAFAGLAYLIWFSRRALQGKVKSLLMED